MEAWSTVRRYHQLTPCLGRSFYATVGCCWRVWCRGESLVLEAKGGRIDVERFMEGNMRLAASCLHAKMLKGHEVRLTIMMLREGEGRSPPLVSGVKCSVSNRVLPSTLCACRSLHVSALHT